MKNSFLFIFLAAVLILNSSCQKDFSYEGGYAKGELQKTSLGECEPVAINGRYQKDSLLNNKINYVDVQVKILKKGIYFIKTDTVNGYSFSAAGVFTIEGLNTVRLLASGRPIVKSSDVFTVKFDTSVCQFNIVVVSNAGGGTTAPALFKFDCTSIAIAGTYQQGTPTTAANIITLPITVSSGGSYNITTSNNGVTFTGSGILASTPSAQTITLHATVNNVPITAGAFAYTITSGSGTACTANITYSSASFSQTDSIVAIIDSVYFTFNNNDSAKFDNTSIPGYGGLRIKGTSNAAGAETFTMATARLGSSIAAGTYTINNYPASINTTNYLTGAGNFSRTSNLVPGMLQNFGFTIIITSVAATKVTGTFSGRLLVNGVGPTYKTITDGIFSVTVYP